MADDANFENWFESNDISKNLCSFVPFPKHESINIIQLASSTNLPEKPPETETTNSSPDNSREDKKLPPHKKICSGVDSVRDFAESLEEESGDNESTTNRKSYNYESILSLLVKTLHRNLNSVEASNDENSISKSSESLFKLHFLTDQDTTLMETSGNDPLSFKNSRIGDENDFILNLLEQASALNNRCRINIEKTVENINIVNQRKFTAYLGSQSIENPTESSVTYSADKSTDETQISMHNTKISAESKPKADDELNNKKLKARVRQQKLLAQMSSNQKAFLRNPNNKTEIEAFEELVPQLTSPTHNLTNEEATSSSVREDVSMLSQKQNKNNLEIDSSSNMAISNIEASHLESKTDKSSLLGSSPLNAPLKDEEMYDCCICRISSRATEERPIGAIALIQSTNSKYF